MDSTISLTVQELLDNVIYLAKMYGLLLHSYLGVTARHILSSRFFSQFAHEHVISPFLTMILHLMTSQDELVETLEKKDKEIEDYKFQGATVSRGQ